MELDMNFLSAEPSTTFFTNSTNLHHPSNNNSYSLFSNDFFSENYSPVTSSSTSDENITPNNDFSVDTEIQNYLFGNLDSEVQLPLQQSLVLNIPNLMPSQQQDEQQTWKQLASLISQTPVANSSTTSSSPTNSSSESGEDSHNGEPPLKKRRTKRKADQIEQDNRRLNELLTKNNNDLSKEEKEEKRKLRNRLSAKKSRDCKKEEMEVLLQEKQEVLQKSKQLEAQLLISNERVKQLENEVSVLKQELSKYQTPNVPLIMDIQKSKNVKKLFVFLFIFCFGFLFFGKFGDIAASTASSSTGSSSGTPTLNQRFTQRGLLSVGNNQHIYLDPENRTTDDNEMCEADEEETHKKKQGIIIQEEHIFDDKIMNDDMLLENHNSDEQHEDYIQQELKTIEQEIMKGGNLYLFNQEKQYGKKTLYLISPLKNMEQEYSPSYNNSESLLNNNIKVEFEILIPIEISNESDLQGEKTIRVVHYKVDSITNPILYQHLQSQFVTNAIVNPTTNSASAQQQQQSIQAEHEEIYEKKLQQKVVSTATTFV